MSASITHTARAGRTAPITVQLVKQRNTVSTILKRYNVSIIMATRILPLELIDKAIGSQIWILMRGKTEVVGILRGFDDYVSLANV